MATNAFRGIGTLLKKGSNVISNVQNIDGPSPAAGREEITSLDSDGGYKEFMPSDIDPGDLKLNLYYNPTVYNAFLNDLQAGTVATYSITTSSTPPAVYTFDAFVLDCPMKIEPKAITFSATLAITGPITPS